MLVLQQLAPQLVGEDAPPPSRLVRPFPTVLVDEDWKQVAGVTTLKAASSSPATTTVVPQSGSGLWTNTALASPTEAPAATAPEFPDSGASSTTTLPVIPKSSSTVPDADSTLPVESLPIIRPASAVDRAPTLRSLPRPFNPPVGTAPPQLPPAPESSEFPEERKSRQVGATAARPLPVIEPQTLPSTALIVLGSWNESSASSTAPMTQPADATTDEHSIQVIEQVQFREPVSAPPALLPQQLPLQSPISTVPESRITPDPAPVFPLIAPHIPPHPAVSDTPRPVQTNAPKVVTLRTVPATTPSVASSRSEPVQAPQMQNLEALLKDIKQNAPSSSVQRQQPAVSHLIESIHDAPAEQGGEAGRNSERSSHSSNFGTTFDTAAPPSIDSPHHEQFQPPSLGLNWRGVASNHAISTQLDAVPNAASKRVETVTLREVAPPPPEDLEPLTINQGRSSTPALTSIPAYRSPHAQPDWEIGSSGNSFAGPVHQGEHCTCQSCLGSDACVPFMDEATCESSLAPMFSLGVKAGKERTILDVRGMVPLVEGDLDLLYTDLRGRFDDSEANEGHFGLGYRTFLDNEEWIFGTYAYYDLRKTSQRNRFNQFTIGAELMSEDWDFRINAYFPNEGAKPSQVERGFSLGTILTDQFQERGLRGFNAEVGKRMLYWGRFDEVEVHWYVGGYRFANSAPGFRTISGPSTRVELRNHDLPFFGEQSRLTAGLEVTTDKVRNGQYWGFLQLQIPLSPKQALPKPTPLERRMLDFPLRTID